MRWGTYSPKVRIFSSKWYVQPLCLRRSPLNQSARLTRDTLARSPFNDFMDVTTDVGEPYLKKDPLERKLFLNLRTHRLDQIWEVLLGECTPVLVSHFSCRTIRIFEAKL